MRALLTVVVSACVLLTACGGSDDTQTGPETRATSQEATPSPNETPSVEETPVRVQEVEGVTFTPTGEVIGMHVAGAQEGKWPGYEIDSLRLWDTGTSWLQIEAEEGTYRWDGLDKALETAEAAGVTDALMVLGPTPVWNASNLEGVQYPVAGAASVPENLKAWDEFVRAAVTRYKGRIGAYQIWNEASLKMFWQGSPEEMADLTERAYKIVKEEDPEALVVGASTTVRLSKAYQRFFPAYLNALSAKGWPVDVLAVHSYAAGDGDVKDRAKNLQTVRKTLTQAGAGEMAMWDTELNYGLAGPGPIEKTQISDEVALEWVVRTQMDSLKNGIERTYWYIWTEEPYDLLGMQFTNNSGAAAGLRTLSQWLGGAWGGCTTEEGVSSCYVRNDGKVSEIIWSPDGERAVTGFEGNVSVCDAGGTCEQRGEVVAGEAPVLVTPGRGAK